MKALVKVGYACNEHCTFCHTQDVREVQGSAEEVSAKIVRARQLGHGMVVLSGGEPTIRPELFRWAAEIQALGMEVGLVTNGRVLAYPDVLERLLGLGLRYVYMSLHGGEAKVHNALVRAVGFEEARQAIRNLSGRGLSLTVNCVVTRQNVDHLEGLVDALLPHRDLTLKFSCVAPKGGAAHLYEKLVVPVAYAAAKVGAAIRHGLAKAGGDGPRFAHDGFPLCHLPGLEGLYDDLKTHRYATMVEIGEPDFFPVDDKDKVLPEGCRACALRGPCPGLYRGYLERYGAGELRPRGGPRSNSFTWVFEGIHAEGVADDRCPIREDSVTPWDRGRTLFVRHQGKIGRYRTATRDFADVDLEAVKHDLGQVYLDASRKPAPDDFARDLVKLARAGVCAGCEARDACTGLFEPVFEDLFSRDDAAVRAVLAGLSGDVLDVGCGEGPYDDVLGPLAAAGTIRYAGLEPDAARAAAARARRGWGRYEAKEAEALDAEAAYDHALVLRSWNHLRDPAAAVAALGRALRPGGTLTVVDNVAFGLARTPAQAGRAEASTAGFEHHRDDRAADAAAVLAAHGFAVEEVREVRPDGSNQWLVRARRARC